MGIRIALFGLLLVTAAVHAENLAQTGSYTASFTQRSPFSSLKTIAQRFAIAKPGADYDLGAEKFMIHVPADYDPASPIGLIVLLNYKDSDAQLNDGSLKILDDHHLAMITRCKAGGDPINRGGAALDAAFNMQQRYKIDPARIYLFHFNSKDNMEDVTGQRLFTGFPEVFSGAMLYDANKFWLPLKTNHNSAYPANLAPPPPPSQKTQAGKHPLVLTFNGPDDEFIGLLSKGWTSQGFRSTKTMKIGIDDFHYPNYTPGWFTETIEYLDAHKPAAPASRPTTR